MRLRHDKTEGLKTTSPLGVQCASFDDLPRETYPKRDTECTSEGRTMRGLLEGLFGEYKFTNRVPNVDPLG